LSTHFYYFQRDDAEDFGEEHERLKSDLLLAQRRIEGLQAALNVGSEVDEDERLNELSDLDEEEIGSVTTTTDNLTSHNDSSEHQAPPLNESVAS
jgi:hypothetical protein